MLRFSGRKGGQTACLIIGVALAMLWTQPALASNNNCENFTVLFAQRDFAKIEGMFKRAAQELGYPDSSVYLNQFYAKSPREQVMELRRVYRGCYSLKNKDELLVNLLR